MSTATIFGSFPNPTVQSATAPATAVVPVFDPLGRDSAPRAAPINMPAAQPVETATALGAWLTRIQQAFDRWTESNAQSRADARLWDIACSDPRIMGELMHARMRDDSETLGEPVAVLAVPAASVLEAAPAVRQPHQRTAGQGWGRIIEDAYQNRFHQTRHQRA